jgi:hypothetical protein
VLPIALRAGPAVRYSYRSPAEPNAGAPERSSVKITRGITAPVVFAGLAAAGFASPAWADDTTVPAETYTFNLVGGTQPTTWVVTQCGTQCLHIEDSGNSITDPWSADAYALNGYWTLFVDRKDMITCPDGSKFPSGAMYNWNPAGQGLVSATNDGECGDPPGPISANFTLTKVG